MRKWALRTLLALFSIGLCEITLRLAAFVSPQVNYHLSPPWDRVVIRDPVFGIRLSPNHPGNDRWGFRNRAVPDRCDVLAVGDSMTYGYAASAENCWPRQLESIGGKSVYNMSCPHYGPCEYEALLGKGLSLEPKLVVVGIYIGNDFLDAFRTVYHEGRFSNYRSQSQATRQALIDADRHSPLRGVVQELVGSPAPATSGGWPVRKWLAEKSALYALAREGYHVAINPDPPLLAGGEKDPERERKITFRFDADARFRTVLFSPQVCSIPLDMDDPRMREGRVITETILLAVHARLQARAIRFIVVVIPTKQRVYGELIRRSGAAVPASFFDVLDQEARVTADLEDFLNRHGIEVVDALAPLRSCFDKGVRQYPDSSDNHPLAPGYRVIAEAVHVGSQRTGPKAKVHVGVGTTP